MCVCVFVCTYTHSGIERVEHDVGRIADCREYSTPGTVVET